MTISISSIFLILIIAQSLLFAVVLITYKGTKQVSNRILGLFLGALGFQMTIYLLLDLEKVPAIWLSGTGIVFAYGPLMYLYARSLIYNPFHFHRLDPLHFLPTVIFIILMLLGIDVRSKFSWLLYVSLGIYMTLAFREINRYEQVLINTQSAPQALTLRWLKLSFGLFTIILSTDLISYLMYTLTDWQIATQYMQYIVLGMVMFFVNFLLIKGLKQPQIFLGISSEESTLMEDLGSLNRHLISKEYQNEIHQLQAYMETEHPYLNGCNSFCRRELK